MLSKARVLDVIDGSAKDTIVTLMGWRRLGGTGLESDRGLEPA